MYSVPRLVFVVDCQVLKAGHSVLVVEGASMLRALLAPREMEQGWWIGID